jgi:hypothetical protein
MRNFLPRRGVTLPLAVGIAAGVLTVVYGTYDAQRALVAWVAASGFGLATVVGALTLVMVLHVTGAQWWLALRRVFLGVAGVTPLFVLIFVPIAVSIGTIYPWMHAPPGLEAPTLAALEHQRAWNNPGFFIARAVVYLGTFAALSILLGRADAAWDSVPSAENMKRERRISGAGIPILAFALTFASFDWLMSIQPGWQSDMYGLYVFTSGFVTALAVLAVGGWVAQRAGLLPDGVGPDHFHAIGRLMLMATILWTYIAFFQLMLIWIANIPHEITFYHARGGWKTVNFILFFGRFVVPFFALLSRPLKRRPGLLACVGVLLIVMGALDFAWLVIPSVTSNLAAADALPFVCVFALAWAYGAQLVYTRGHLFTRIPAAAPPPAALHEALTYRSP